MSFGKKKTTHHHHQNNYNDRWIHNRFGSVGRTLTSHGRKLWSAARSRQRMSKDIQGLYSRDKTRASGISTNIRNIAGLRGDYNLLRKRLDNWDTTTDVGDVVGLDDVLKNLKSDYQSDIKDVETQLGDYLKTGDFNTRMTQNLDALGNTLRGEFGSDIAALDIEGVRQSIADQGGDLNKLTEDFAGISSDMDWIKQLDLGSFDDRLNTQSTNLTNLINQQGDNLQDQLTNQQTQWRGDLTDLQNILESGRGEALANLESDLGKDRAADLLNLRQQLEEGRLSDIQGMAGNLRQEFGDQVYGLSDTFDQRLGDVQTALGGDISKLFEQSGELSGQLESGLNTLTSGLGTTTQQLEALRDSFGDYKTDAATNLANVQQAFGQQVGDLGTDFTDRLSDLKSSTAEDILGTATEAAEGRAQLRSDLTAERQKQLSDLDTSWSGRLQAQDARLQDQFRQGEDALNKRLSDITSSMNYRMLGDSAQGVKIRRSRAYNQGKTRSGTGQLGRSMKISTLNI